MAYGPPANSDTIVKIGHVISAKLPDGTDVEPGAQVSPGTAVTLVVSAGPGRGHDHLGRQPDRRRTRPRPSQADALKIAPTEVFSDTVPAGLIIDQSPGAGTTGHRTDTISVNVSKGPELVPAAET